MCVTYLLFGLKKVAELLGRYEEILGWLEFAEVAGALELQTLLPRRPGIKWQGRVNYFWSNRGKIRSNSHSTFALVNLCPPSVTHTFFLVETKF